MFKKKPTIKPASPLRSSDRRKLADQIIADYSLAPAAPSGEQTPEQTAEATAAHTSLRNALLPENAQSSRFTTTHGPDPKVVSGTLYIGTHGSEDGARILWFQVEGRLFPTVYTLWRNPGLVPLLHTPEIVVGKLKGGADLMTPGLAGGPPFPAKAALGTVVAVASLEKETVPVAVGACEIDVAGLGSVRGAKGCAVRNLHWVGDELWAWGSGGRAGKEAPDQIEGWLEQGLVRGMERVGLEDGEDEGGVAVDALDTAEPSREELGTGERISSAKGDNAEQSPEDTQPDLMTQKEIDDAFRNAFLYGLHNHMTTQTTPNHGLVFPLSQSSVMSNLIQPFLPAFTTEQKEQLQIKKTSWKNIKKFIKSLDKQNLVKSKEKDGHETVITEIDFRAAAIVDFKPYRIPRKDTTANTSSAHDDKASDPSDPSDDSIGQKVQVISYFKPTTKLQPIFASTTSHLLNPPEVRELIATYIDTNHLVSDSNKRLVKLDPTLGNAVFDGSSALDNEVLAKGTVPRDVLIERVLKAMAPAYAISRNGTEAKAKSGAPPKIHVVLETRSGSKTVTKVSGLEAYHVNARPLAEELRKVCAGATSVEPLAGAAKKFEKEVMEVMVQGPQKEAVLKALERRGVNAKWVEYVDKTKAKKR